MSSALSPLVLVISLLVIVVLSMPAALIAKVVMGRMFGRDIWFALAMVPYILAACIPFATEMLFGFGIWETLEDANTQRGQQEIIFNAVLLVLLYWAAVPDTRLRWIAPWKWIVVVAIQYAISVAIILGLTYAFAPSLIDAALGR